MAKKLAASAGTQMTPRTKTPLDVRLAELITEQRNLTSRIVKLESHGARAMDTGEISATEARARQLLNGVDAIDGGQLHGGVELRVLLQERAAVDRALEIGRQRQVAEASRRARDLYLERVDEWRELARQRVQTVVVLRRLNRLVTAFRHELRGPMGLPSLPVDLPVGELLGDGSVPADAGCRLIELAISAGLVTPGEISSWME